MKRSILTSGLAAAAVLLTGVANATITIGGVTYDAAFYVSGASAARKIPPAVASGPLCAGNVRQWAFSGDSKDFKITACNWGSTGTAVVPGGPTIPAALGGKSIAIISRAEGGSLFGVKPISDPKTIAHVNFATCPADTPNDGNETLCSGTTPKQSDLGISDEDGKFLCAASQGECTPAEVAGLDNAAYQSSPVYQIGWQLQAGNTFPLNDLTAASVTAIFNGTYTRTDQVCAANGTSCAANNLAIARRTNTSGTMAGHRHIWTGIGFCGSNTPLGFVTGAVNDASACAGGSYCVVEYSSSSGIPNLLTAYPNRAIGIVNITNTPPAGTKSLSVDGIPATTANLVTGEWKYYHESTAQFNTTTQVNTTESTAAEKVAFANFFTSLLQDPVVLDQSGIVGVAGLPTVSPRPPTNPDTTGTAWHTKFGNNCRAPLLAFPF